MSSRLVASGEKLFRNLRKAEAERNADEEGESQERISAKWRMVSMIHPHRSSAVYEEQRRIFSLLRMKRHPDVSTTHQQRETTYIGRRVIIVVDPGCREGGELL